MSGVVFDTGALIALDRGDRTLTVLVSEARRTRSVITVPAGCIAQAWRNPRRQARIAALLRRPEVTIVPLGDEESRRIGLLLAATGTSDVVDGHVAVCAHRLGQTVLTSDPDDLRRLAPGIDIHRV
ncbi:MAG: PIN domain-containing protein [Pseudonocardiales bacterium]|nr:PIN domain-containing protein [Pseudonocardiales bacterium]